MHSGAESEERRAGVGEWRVGVRSGDRRAENTKRKRGGTERKLRRNRAETEAEIKAETGRQILKTQFG